MKLTELDNQVSVSDQITVAEVADLSSQGIEVVVCNRPDREAEDEVLVVSDGTGRTAT